MVERKVGDRSKILLNEVDILILKIISSSKKEVSNRVLKKSLNINDQSLRTHLGRLLDFNFVSREKAPNENRYVTTITETGKRVLDTFWKFVKK